MTTTTGLDSVSAWLETQTGINRRELYKQPATALAVFRRMLSHLAKTLVMALLYSPEPIKHSYFKTWVKPDNIRDLKDAFQQLQLLNIVDHHKIKRAEDEFDWILEEPFASSLRNALTGGGSHSSFGVPIGNTLDDDVDLEFLDDYARMQWESILYFIVGSAGSNADRDFIIGEGSKKLLEAGKLVERSGRGHSITQQGFTFLLQDVTTQLWSMLITYIDMSKDLAMNQLEALSFLFMLGSLEVGLAYSTSTLTKTQKMMLDDLNDLGVVYKPEDDETKKSDRFYPTRLAHTLNSDANAFANSLSADLGASSDKGFIVVETNYRIYAYTNSDLRIAILTLFMRLDTKYPNMISGRLTKSSIQGAIALGITSQQIIDYLNAHAHPIMASNPKSTNPSQISDDQKRPTLPPTVIDQIRLWQIEGDRMQTTAGYLFKDFDKQEDYEASWRYAEQIGTLTWRSDAKRAFFATEVRQTGEFVRGRVNATNKGSKTGSPANGTPRAAPSSK